MFLLWAWGHIDSNRDKPINVRAYAYEYNRSRYDVLHLVSYLMDKELIEESDDWKAINDHTYNNWDNRDPALPHTYSVALTLAGMDEIDTLKFGIKHPFVGIFVKDSKDFLLKLAFAGAIALFSIVWARGGCYRNHITTAPMLPQTQASTQPTTHP